jgi:hypothetical protein
VVQKTAEEVRGIIGMGVPMTENVSKVLVRLCEYLSGGQCDRCRLRVDDVVGENQAMPLRDWLHFMCHVSVPILVSAYARRRSNILA